MLNSIMIINHSRLFIEILGLTFSVDSTIIKI